MKTKKKEGSIFTPSDDGKLEKLDGVSPTTGYFHFRFKKSLRIKGGCIGCSIYITVKKERKPNPDPLNPDSAPP